MWRIAKEGIPAYISFKNTNSSTPDKLSHGKNKLAEQHMEMKELLDDPIISLRISQIENAKRLDSLETQMLQVHLDKEQAQQNLRALPEPEVTPKEKTSFQS